MGDIGEVAKVIGHELDPLAHGSVDELLAAAQQRVAANVATVTTILEGSGNPAAQVLRDRMYKVATMLGDLQNELAGMHGTKDALFTIWGIGDSGTPAAPTVQHAGGEAMAANSNVSRPLPWQRTIGDIIGDMGLAGREKGSVTLVRSTLVTSGLQTVADVLALGKEKLRYVRMGERMGEPKLATLQQIVHYEYPGIDIPERPDPGIASQTHGSLTQVPWLAVVRNKRLFDAAYLLHGKRISVQDVLTKSREDLFGGTVNDDEFATLRADALNYAIAFNKAKYSKTR